MQQTNNKGFIDLVIESEDFCTVVEFKNIQISYLDLKDKGLDDKAKKLKAMTVEEVLGLLFKDKFRSGTIREWVERDVFTQLQSYTKGRTANEHSVDKKFRAYAAVIIGSRQILIREMDRNGSWVGDYELV